MKRIVQFFVVYTLLILQSTSLLADRHGFVNTVVIDPGHGGNHPGTVGRKSKEKDIVLAISLKLGAYIEKNLPDVKVIYTRTTDVNPPLHRRAQIANENNADLFISIHLNGATNTSAIGTETFVMGTHVSQANLEVARRENQAILYEEDYQEMYGGFDPNSPEATIIFSLYQEAYIEQSLIMADLVQTEFRERARRVDRGVKQAGFVVLYRAAIPGVLVEAGFLTNPREEEYLMSAEGQDQIASAIFRAFRQYKQQQDALAASRRHQRGSQTAASTPAAATNAVNQANTAARSSEPAASSAEVQTTMAGQPLPTVSFRVQIASSSSLRPENAPEFRGLNQLMYYHHEGLYKYTVGNETSMEEAVALQRRLQRNGFPDAFIVAFQGSERISISEAQRLLENRNP